MKIVTNVVVYTTLRLNWLKGRLKILGLKKALRKESK